MKFLLHTLEFCLNSNTVHCIGHQFDDSILYVTYLTNIMILITTTFSSPLLLLLHFFVTFYCAFTYSEIRVITTQLNNNFSISAYSTVVLQILKYVGN